MSIRFDNTADVLSRTLGGALTIGTGTVSQGIWVRLKSDLNARRHIASLSDAVSGAGETIGFEINTDGTSVRMNGAGAITNGYGLTIDVWVWLVAIRQSSFADFYVYDDSSSTTPIFSHTGSDDTYNYAALDSIVIGGNPYGFGASDFEAQLWKASTGIAWNSTQRRSESQFFALQTGGYTEGFSYGLETTTADQYGLNEYGGNNNPLSNSGCTNGASRPSQLETAGGGSSGGLYVKSNRLYSFPTYRRSL